MTVGSSSGTLAKVCLFVCACSEFPVTSDAVTVASPWKFCDVTHDDEGAADEVQVWSPKAAFVAVMLSWMYGASLVFWDGLTTRDCTNAGYTLATRAQTRAHSTTATTGSSQPCWRTL